MQGETRNGNTRHGRLKAIGAGLLLVALGWLRLFGGVVTHWTRELTFSWGLMAAGPICILSAFTPGSWISKAEGTRTRKSQNQCNRDIQDL